MEKFDIRHDAKKQRFYLDIEDETSELLYKKVDAVTLEYYRTYVPEAHRHQGIATKLAKCALEYARKNNYEVITSCPFVKDYVDGANQA